MFIAQAYNVQLSFSEITVMMLTLMLASKGIAGVPRSALVVLAATIPSFNIPVAGILLLMGIDHFLDMGRSAINVLGNGIATAMLSKMKVNCRKRSRRLKSRLSRPKPDRRAPSLTGARSAVKEALTGTQGAM